MIGIIGGSGLYNIEGIKVLEEVKVETPFGEPSDSYIVAEYKDKKVIFLPRHGRGHKFPPHLINFRANIWGFRKLGVNRILSVSAVGGINPNFNPGDFVISDNFVDFTKSRIQTFYEGIYSKDSDTNYQDEVEEYLNTKRVVHIDVTEPFCPIMRESLIKACRENGSKFHEKGVYVATEGPRLETKAEIKMFSNMGFDIVGMTLVPEVVLARELKIHFGSISIVTNLAAGISENRLTSDEVVEMMHKKNEEIKQVILKFLDILPDNFNCQCEEVLKGAAI
ncbi:MAG: S-methyl-5'-thioadenosine phosphorylase [Hydrogenothermaceae bacterium]|nr:S-methyl-5'-thioadenosine phosphorylase [Hydrogenothermaceae bacterium]